MANTRWIDQSQPQTLYMATILLYINAGFWLLDVLLGAGFLGLFADVAAIFAGLGIANEKKAGYWGGMVVAGLDVLWLLDLFRSPRRRSALSSTWFSPSSCSLCCYTP